MAPKLKYGNMESKILYGKVTTQYANPDYIKAHCETPILAKNDPDYVGNTCIEIDHSGQA